MADNKDVYWWESKQDAAHSALFTYVEAIEEEQRDFHDALLKYATLYSSREIESYTWKPSRRAVAISTENLVKQNCDAATALIAKHRPRPTMQTDGAPYSIQEQAKALEQVTDGLFGKYDVYRKAIQAFRDSTYQGSGVIKLYDNEITNTLHVERCLIDEIIVDEAACGTGDPQQLHHRRRVSKSELQNLFPEHRAKIATCHDDKRTWSRRKIPTDQCLVIEGWSLPKLGFKGNKLVKIPGRHVLAVENVTLLDEEWNEDYFPFVVYRWAEPVSGWYGTGLAEELVGIQLRANQIHTFIEECQNTVSAPKVLIERNSRVQREHLDSEIGRAIVYQGTPPQFITPQAVHPEIYSQSEKYSQKAFEITGISRLSAQSMKPAGVESAVALRALSDVETERFAIQSQAYEEFILTIAKRLLQAARRCWLRQEEGKVTDGAPKFEIRINGKDVSGKLDWKNVKFDTFVDSIVIFGTSQIPRTPAGRLAYINDLLQMGMIDQRLGRRLFGHPDIMRADQVANAPIDDIELVAENLLKNVDETPDITQDLEFAIPYITSCMRRAKVDGESEETLQRFRDWLSQAAAIQAEAMKAQQAQMAAAQAAQAPPPGPQDAGAMPPDAMPPGAIPPGQGG